MDHKTVASALAAFGYEPRTHGGHRILAHPTLPAGLRVVCTGDGDAPESFEGEVLYCEFMTARDAEAWLIGSDSERDQPTSKKVFASVGALIEELAFHASVARVVVRSRAKRLVDVDWNGHDGTYQMRAGELVYVGRRGTERFDVLTHWIPGERAAITALAVKLLRRRLPPVKVVIEEVTVRYVGLS